MALANRTADTVRELTGSIEGMMKSIELLPYIEELNKKWNLGISSPLGVIFEICHAMGIMNELKEYLSYILIPFMPALEVGVKGALLTNLMSSISCNSNPMIPNELREFFFNESFQFDTSAMVSLMATVATSGITGDVEGENRDVVNNIASNMYGFEQTRYAGAGLNIPISGIDLRGMLNYSPYKQRVNVPTTKTTRGDDGKLHTTTTWETKEGKDVTGAERIKSNTWDYSTLYFDVPQDRTNHPQAELCRRRDMNAYLWYAKSKADLNPVIGVDKMSDIGTATNITPGGPTTLYDAVKITNPTTSFKNIRNGAVISYNNATNRTVVTNTKYGANGEVTEFLLMPVSSRSLNPYVANLNWYVNPASYWTENLFGPTVKDDEGKLTYYRRDYTKDKPLFNTRSNDGQTLNFHILPKPFVKYPYINNNYKKADTIVKIVFDSLGVADRKNGRFSVSPWCVNNEVQHTAPFQDGNGKNIIEFTLRDNLDNMSNDITLRVELSSYNYYLWDKQNNRILSGTSVSGNEEKLAGILYECYPGLTVYQFCYDFIMGQRLFDAKSILTSLMTNLFGLNVDVRLSFEFEAAKEKIAALVNNVIESQPGIDTCFFTFDNIEQDNQLRKAIERKAQGYSFDDGTSRKLSPNTQAQLQGYLESLEGQSDAQKSATVDKIINYVTASLSEGSDASYTLTGEAFVKELVTQMVYEVVVNSLFTPKVLMILQVNNYIVGKYNSDVDLGVNLEQLMESCIGLIYNIIKEVVNLLLQELLNWLLSKIQAVTALFLSGIIAEYLDMYLKLITKIIDECGFKIKGYTGQIDDVRFAEIENSTGIPKTENC